jgi:hypothetical protein
MKITFMIFSVMFFLSGCYTPEPEKDGSTDEKVTRLIADIYIMQALLEKADATYRDSLKQVYTGELCALHRISEKQLEDLLGSLASRGDTLLRHQTNAMDTIRYWQDKANRMLSTGIIINN